MNSANKSYSVLNTHKSMLLQTLAFFGNSWCESCNLIKRYLKEVCKSKPPVPRYKFMWDVSNVLRFLKIFYPLNKLSLKLLTLKALALVALASPPRSQTLVSMNVNNFICERKAIVFTFPTLLKTSKVGHAFSLEVDHFKDEDLCAMHTLLVFYLQKTQSIRKSSQLFISYVTYKAITSCTIARWLRMVMDLAGIDTSYFKAHSFRGAAVSATFTKGCALKTILDTADWTSDKNFRKFYYRKSFSTNILFSNAVFKTSELED